jgi:hypothetical protein
MSTVTQFTHAVAPTRTTLADKAMLVRLKRSMFSPFIADKVATQQVEVANGVANAGRYRKHLLKDGVYFNATQKAYGAIYDFHIKHTLPWLDDGLRMLPSAMYMDYVAEMRKLESEAARCVAMLEQNWYAEVTHDSSRLGAMFNQADYPADIASKYGVSLQFLPVPSAGDFRVAIDPADEASLEQAIKDAEGNVASYVIDQLLEPLRRAAAKLSVPIGQEGAIFRDSLIENMVEVAERLPRLNINNDPTLAKAINDVRDLANHYNSNIDLLREAPIIRESAANKVKELVNNLAGLGF